MRVACGSVTILRGSFRSGQSHTDELFQLEHLGPPISTTPFAGSPTALRPTAAATSPETMGRILASGRCTVSPSVTPSASPFANSKNWVAWMMEYGMPEVLIRVFLDLLGAEIPAPLEPVGTDHGQRHMVRHAGLGLRLEQMGGGRAEELQDCLVLERGRVRYTSTTTRAPCSTSASPSPVNVLTPAAGRRRHCFLPVLAEPG